jgi:hypothetical protein
MHIFLNEKSVDWIQNPPSHVAIFHRKFDNSSLCAVVSVALASNLVTFVTSMKANTPVDIGRGQATSLLGGQLHFEPQRRIPFKD